MRTLPIVLAIVLAGQLLAQNRAYLPKVGPEETPVLEDGEIAVKVLPDGEPVGLAVGDGSTSSGRSLFDVRSILRFSPIARAAVEDYSVELGGSAYWTNGLISFFHPGTEMNTSAVGTVTLRLLSSKQMIKSVSTTQTGADFSLSRVISSDGSYATLTGRMADTAATPGGDPIIKECYLESVSMDLYSDRTLVNSTQDMRAVRVLMSHPIGAGVATNEGDFAPVTVGWYSNRVQDAVSSWSTHPATAAITQRAGMVIDDGISLQQRFSWSYAPNGYMALTHTSDTSAPVMSIEAMDPWPWITATPTGHVATLQWTTNGISAASWAIQTASSLVNPVWTNALILATNLAPAGYASMTASNVLGGTSVFWRVHAIGATQQAAAMRFGPAVYAPSFYGSGSGLTGVLHAMPSVSTGRLEIVGAFSAGMSNSLNGASTIALGRQAVATDGGSFVWNNAALASPLEPYFSHGQATFSINPEGGLTGFYIGASNLQSILDSRQVSLPGTFTGGVVATSGNVPTNGGAIFAETVSVGTTDTSYPIQVSGSIASGGSVATLVKNLNASGSASVYVQNNTNVTGGFTCFGSGMAQATLKNKAAVISTAGLTFMSDSSTSSTGTNDIQFMTAGYNTQPKMFIKSDGKVGIGTNAPSTTLEVNGTLKAGATTLGVATVAGLEATSAGNWSMNSFGGLLLNVAASYLSIPAAVPGTAGAIRMNNTITSSNTQYLISLTPTYNQSNSVAANTEIYINRTETLVGSGTNSFVDFRVGNSSKFRISNKGEVYFGPSIGGKQAGLITDGTNFWFINVDSVTNTLTAN